MTDANPQKLLSDEQSKLDHCLIDAAGKGNTQTVQTLLANGANVHANDDWALRAAADNGHSETVRALLAAGADLHAVDDMALRLAAEDGHTETVKVLLASDANMHSWDDYALRLAACNGHTGTVQILASYIFAPDLWRGKSRAEIETHANTLYSKIKTWKSQPEHLRETCTILIDCALHCWEQVRPAPPQIQISRLPAQPRPL